MNAKDRLIFAVDVPARSSALGIVDQLAGEVGCFKVGLELFIAEGPSLVREINRRAPVFLDLKLHDIPATVGRATEAAARLGVRFVTVHAEQDAALRAAVSGAAGALGVLAVSVLTSVSAAELALATGGGRSLQEVVVERALMARDAGCAGVVCSGEEAAVVRRAVSDGGGEPFVIVTPGVRMPGAASGAGGDDQRRVVTPEAAIEAGADLIVVGRPIRDAADPVAAARAFVAALEPAAA